MTVLQRMGQGNRDAEMAQGAREFCALARYIAMGRGSLINSVMVAKEMRALPRIQQVLEAAASSGFKVVSKAAVVAGSTSGWGEPLAQYTLMQDAFLASLRNVSCYDAMLPSMINVPIRQKIAVLTGGATGSTPLEGNVKLISQMALSASQITENKSLAIVVVTEELTREGNNRLFSEALAEEVAYQVDLAFLAELTGGLSPITSNGGTSIGILQDISAALNAVDTNSSSLLYVITHPDVSKSWCTKTTSTGAIAFPEMSPTGGRICNMPVLVTDAAAQQIIVADAAQIAATSSRVEMDSSNQATVQLDSAPNSPPIATANVVSLWQNNFEGLKANRWWSAERLRTTAVGLVTGVTYTGGANSPA